MCTFVTNPSTMNITFYGHSCFGIEAEGLSLIIDPFISGNSAAAHIDVDGLKADYILLTHGHQDHILDTERIAQRTKAKLISNFEIVSHFGNKGIEGFAMNHGGVMKAEWGSVKMVNAIHSSSFPDGSYAGNPAGFVICIGEKTIYAAGDTCVSMDMQLIPLMGYQIDLAILPIGDTFTMGYKEASIAAEFVKTSKVIGCHYNTFPPIQIDTAAAQDYFQHKGQELILLDIGSSIEV